MVGLVYCENLRTRRCVFSVRVLHPDT